MSFLSINKTLSSVNELAYLPSFSHSSLFPSLSSQTQSSSTSIPDTEPQSLLHTIPFSRNQLPAATDSQVIKLECVAVRTQRILSHSPQTHLNLNYTQPESLCIPESLSIKGEITLTREGNNPQKKIWLTEFLPSRLQTTCSNEQPHLQNMTAPVLDH